jgi:hypothetical protein
MIARVIRALIFAAASLATAWWLLRAPEPELPASLAPAAGGSAQPPATDLPRAAAVEVGEAPDAEVRPTGPAGGEPLGAAQATGADVIADPIPMIEGITLPGGMWNLHTAMERESRDFEWAEQMEREISTYLASKSELGRNFGQPSVLCRSRSCEIQAVGYGPEAFHTWSTATQDLRDQPWRQEMGAGGIYTNERAPNEHAVVLILVRTGRLVRASELRTAPQPPR